MAIVAVSISPVGEGVSVGRYVAEAVRILRDQKRVGYQLGPMFTTLEGDLDETLALVRRVHEAVFGAGASRVSTLIKIDDRRDRPSGMEEKIRSIDQRLARD